MYVCVNLGDEILLRGEECKTWVNLNFFEKWQNGKLPLMCKLQNCNFSRSWMMKQISLFYSSHEIKFPRRILLNSNTVRFS